MNLVPNWRAVLARAWSIRFIAAAFLFSAAEIALPHLDGILAVSPGTFALLSGCASGGAFVARLIAQREIAGGARE